MVAPHKVDAVVMVTRVVPAHNTLEVSVACLIIGAMVAVAAVGLAVGADMIVVEVVVHLILLSC